MANHSTETFTESSFSTQKLLELITSSWVSQALYVAAELDIAQLLADAPKTAEELAIAAGSQVGPLRRLLLALTTIDICRHCGDDRFEMTAVGQMLRADAPGSLRNWTIWWGKHLWPVWGQLLYSVQTGHSARKLLLGTEGFEHLEQDRDGAAIFHRAAAELTRISAEAIAQAYDFSPLARIVDVGGGCGELLACILARAPKARGVLFDQAHAIAQGRVHLETAGLASRCEFIAGDFFESVPAGGDAYLLKSVLHDWNDEKSRLILENTARAMNGRGRLLLLEEMIPEHLTASPLHQAIARGDLNMLVALAAKERTEVELRELLASAGFRVSRVLPTGSTFTLIEAIPERSQAG